ARSSARRPGEPDWKSMRSPSSCAEAANTPRLRVEHETGTATEIGCSFALSASSIISSASSTRRVAEASMSRPKGVRLTPRPVRSSSRAPNCPSSPAMRRLATGCGMPVAAAPSVMLPSSLTAVKVRQASTKSITSGYALLLWITTKQSSTVWLGQRRVACADHGDTTDHTHTHERPAQPMTRRSLRTLTASLTASTLTAFALTGRAPCDDSTGTGSAMQNPDHTQQAELIADLESIEDEFGARVGVSAVDTADGTTVAHRADERFGFASSLKVFAVAELLDRTSPEELDKRVTWTQADVDAAEWTPVTEKHVDDGLPLEDIAEAALRVSDNAAMNLVLDEVGGPEGLDAALEDAGDAT